MKKKMKEIIERNNKRKLKIKMIFQILKIKQIISKLILNII